MGISVMGGGQLIVPEAQAQLRLFRRQVLQLLPLQQLSWPDSKSLIRASHQEWIYEQLFDDENNDSLSPARYRLSILKPLISRIEGSIVDPEEDGVSDDLMNSLATLMFVPLPSETDAAQQKGWVTYTPVLYLSKEQHEEKLCEESSVKEEQPEEPVLKLMENRSVISGAGTTGLRTWEAALHLSSYLCKYVTARELFIKDKHVVELGAGTGFLSILCAKHLGAKHVTSTDGDEGVVDTLKENLFHNDAESEITTGVMRWGWGLKDSLVEHESESHGPVDTVIGADVTYDKAVIPALVSTIRNMFEVWPEVNVLISATIRNENTFAAFERACERNAFQVEELRSPVGEQRSLFHSTDVPIRIFRINAPKTIKDPFKV